MLAASAQFTTASGATSQRLEILRLSSSDSGVVAAADDDVGLDARLRSSLTECWVGLVFSSPEGPR